MTCLCVTRFAKPKGTLPNSYIHSSSPCGAFSKFGTLIAGLGVEPTWLTVSRDIGENLVELCDLGFRMFSLDSIAF